jgi:DNA-binding IclR family transcriptional regulator
MNSKRTYNVPAVSRVLDIFEYLCKKKEASFLEIYKDTEIPKSSTYQILRTLEDRGYVRHIGGMEKYTLGLRFLELGEKTALMIDIRTEAMPILRDLTTKTNETCHLGILDGNEGVYIGKVEGSQPIRLHTWEGRRLPLHCTSLGKILLAWLDEKTLDKKLSELEYIRFTSHTLTNPNDLKKNLKIVKKRGWALDDQENGYHFRCIGVPVFKNDNEVVAAISMTGLDSIFDGERLLELVEEAKKAAHQLSLNIGGI